MNCLGSFKQAMDMMTRAVSGASVAGYEYLAPVHQPPPPHYPPTPTHHGGGSPYHPIHTHSPYTSSQASYNMPATAADGYVPQVRRLAVCLYAKFSLDRFDFSSDFYALDFLRFA